METNTAIKNTVEALIAAGTSFDTDQLELIYHKDLEVIMIDEAGNKMIANKAAFKGLFAEKKEKGEAPLNTWAKFNHIAGSETKGHVIVTRKVKLTEAERKLVLSIDLVWEDGRWQVTREVIFSTPLDN